MKMTDLTIQTAMADFVEGIKRSRSKNTALSYQKGLRFFTRVLEKHQLSIDDTPISELSDEFILWHLDDLKALSPATEQLYTVAVKRFYHYVASRNLAKINLPRLAEFILEQTRRPGKRLPQFPREDIEKVLKSVETYAKAAYNDENERLRAMRDRAFIITLADTGLRVHEICELRRGDVDWNEGRAIIIGKGDKQAIIRFSNRSMRAMKDYLAVRQKLDGTSGRPLPSLPLFARHDKGAGSKVKPISTATGRNIVRDRVRQSLGKEAVGKITPHSFRHYFVTTVLRASGNLKLAQKLARHSNIAVTQRYAHLSDDELDRGYYEIFDKE